MNEPLEQPKKPSRTEFKSSDSPIYCEACDEEFSYGMTKITINANGSKRASASAFCPICQNQAKEI